MVDELVSPSTPLSTVEEMMLPKTEEVWKKRKNTPKKRTITCSGLAEDVMSAYLKKQNSSYYWGRRLRDTASRLRGRVHATCTRNVMSFALCIHSPSLLPKLPSAALAGE